MNNIIKIALGIIVGTLLVTGCKQDNKISYDDIPEKFITSIQDLDNKYLERLTAYEDEDEDEDIYIYRCFLVDENSKLFVANTYGYEEDMLVSILMNNKKVIEVNILYENETEDYGEYVTESWFLDRLLLKIDKPLKLVKRKKTHENEVIAITGATITSRAVLDAINKCIEIAEGKNED